MSFVFIKDKKKMKKEKIYMDITASTKRLSLPILHYKSETQPWNTGQTSIIKKI